jgi:hypothetical protein
MDRCVPLIAALALGCGASSAGGSTADSGVPDDAVPAPDGPPGSLFGPNVLIFYPSMDGTAIHDQIAAIYASQDGAAAEFGTGRYAYFFMPGQYDKLDVELGFYTQVVGLGASPDDTVITGAVRSKGDWQGNGNATRNFWRGAENLAVVPGDGLDGQPIDGHIAIWAVSQGTHLRRMHVKGDLQLDEGLAKSYASGGFIADSVVDGQVSSDLQEQFFTRNTDLQTWQSTTRSYNLVFVGDVNPPAESWPSSPVGVIATTPLVREKPYLYVDSSGSYFVRVPAPTIHSVGHSWATGAAPGTSLPIDRFYIANPITDTALSMNNALAAGKHLLLTPGIYHLETSLKVSLAGTIVLGLGFATLIPDNGTDIIDVDDVGDVVLAGLLLEAGPSSSPTLLQIGPTGSSADHSSAPILLSDVHCRVGGADPGRAARCVILNSRDVILDNVWLWRADHGTGVGWLANTSINGLVVNGDYVTAYGLFVEHFQHYQTLWNGEHGAVYFYQSEMPYDPPADSPQSWATSTELGYPSYKVASGVMNHTALGLGVYANFDNAVTAENAIEAPTAAVMHHMVTVSLGTHTGFIRHIINGNGATVPSGNVYKALSPN